jgi:hypothetical protein
MTFFVYATGLQPVYNRGMFRLTAHQVLSILLLGCVFALGVAAGAVADTPERDKIREEDRLGARSDEYSRTFDTAVSALVHADAATFRSILSSTTTLNESRGPGAIDAIIKTRYIPFFEDFVELTDSITTAPSYDAAGNQGLAMARSFSTSVGEQRSFVIYLVKEKDRVRVGNLLLNVTGEALLQQKANKGTRAERR